MRQKVIFEQVAQPVGQLAQTVPLGKVPVKHVE